MPTVHKTRTHVLRHGAALCVLMLAFAPVSAAPANDACDNPISISGTSPIIVNIDGTGATFEGSIPTQTCQRSARAPAQVDLWFLYTASMTGVASFQMTQGCPSLGVGFSMWTACSNGSEISLSCQLDICTAPKRFRTVAGENYLIRLVTFTPDAIGSLQQYIASNAQLKVENTPDNEPVDLLASASSPAGSGALTFVAGTLSSSKKADLYRIEICNTDTFEALTSSIVNTNIALALFDASGLGVVYNDDYVTLPARARLTNQFVYSTGIYYLAVTTGGNGRLPSSADGTIWQGVPSKIEREPDGPGAGKSLSGWSGFGSFDPANASYVISLTGVCHAPTPCVANFNGLGGVTVTDIFAFLSAWFAGSASADVNGMNGVTVTDIFFFLSHWFAGC